MTATRATEQQQQQQGSRSQTLDKRYGKIGITAVAAAVKHKPEAPPEKATRYIPVDSD